MGGALVDVVVHTMTRRISGQRLMVSFHVYETPNGQIGAEQIHINCFNHRNQTTYELDVTTEDWRVLGFGRITEMEAGGHELGRLCRALADNLCIDEDRGCLCVWAG